MCQLKELNLLNRKSELAGASGKLKLNIDKLIASEVDDMGMTLDKEERINLSEKQLSGKVEGVATKYEC